MGHSVHTVDISKVLAHTISAVLRPVGHPTKFSKMTLEAVYGREMNIPAVSMVDIPAVSMLIARFPKT